MAEKNTTQTPPKMPRMGMGGGPGHASARLPGEKPKDFNGTFWRLVGFMKPYKVGFILVILFTVLAAVFNSLGPRVLGFVTNEITAGAQRMLSGTGGMDFAAIGKVIIGLAAVYLGTSLFRFLELYLMAGVSQNMMFDLRKAIDEKLSRLPLGYYDSNTYGDILSRVTNDVDTVSTSLQQSFTQSVSSLLTIVAVLAMMLWISPTLTLVALVTIPFAAILSGGIIKRSQRLFRGQQNALGQLNGHVEEMYNGHNIIKVFGREPTVIRQFQEINEELYQYGWKAQFISSVMMPITNFFGNVGYVLVTVLGGYFVIGGSLKVGDIQSFIQYLRQFTQPINQTANIANVLQSTMAAAERIFELLDEPEEPKEREQPIELPNPKGTVQLEHVRFGYDPEKIIIKDLSLNVKAGDKIALVGPTGAGKTTLVNLLLRFYDVTSGEIKVDGVNIQDMSRYTLRSLFGMVLQDTWLFKGTILENIRYGKLTASDEEVLAAAKSAFAHQFIQQLPGGYQFELNEDASNISQGQRQLLTIARAILSNPAILILDEATSSVDTRTEVLIQKAMNNLMENRTSFVIAHRLSTIKDSDTILVINDGDIVESGNHKELLAKNGFYANLYNSQFAQNNQI